MQPSRRCEVPSGRADSTRAALLMAVDSSILMEVLSDDPMYRAASLAAVRSARRAGALVARPVVWAEIRGFFKDVAPMRQSFADADK